MRYVTVDILQEDIDAWMNSRTRVCPIRRAIRRQLHEDMHVGTVNIVDRRHGRGYAMTKKARQFVRDVDLARAIAHANRRSKKPDKRAVTPPKPVRLRLQLPGG